MSRMFVHEGNKYTQGENSVEVIRRNIVEDENIEMSTDNRRKKTFELNERFVNSIDEREKLFQTKSIDRINREDLV